MLKNIFTFYVNMLYNSIRMHGDEAFGVVEKPIKTQCEKMHTEIRTQMWRGMRCFLCCILYAQYFGQELSFICMSL